jgi:hypothetical protein
MRPVWDCGMPSPACVPIVQYNAVYVGNTRDWCHARRRVTASDAQSEGVLALTSRKRTWRGCLLLRGGRLLRRRHVRSGLIWIRVRHYARRRCAAGVRDLLSTAAHLFHLEPFPPDAHLGGCEPGVVRLRRHRVCRRSLSPRCRPIFCGTRRVAARIESLAAPGAQAYLTTVPRCYHTRLT